MTAFHRGFAVVLVIFAAVILAISLRAFADNLGQGSPNQEAPLTLAMNGRVGSVSQSEAQAIVNENSHPSLLLAADRLSVADKQLSGTLLFEVPSGVWTQITDVKSSPRR